MVPYSHSTNTLLAPSEWILSAIILTMDNKDKDKDVDTGDKSVVMPIY